MHAVELLLSFLSLTGLEIILGVDNLIFLTLLTEKLPIVQRKSARRWGLMFAWSTRLLLLYMAIKLTNMANSINIYHDAHISLRDMLFIIGGFFLIFKGCQEIYHMLFNDVSKPLASQQKIKYSKFFIVVLQIGIMDIVFSLDSVLTAIGLTDHYWIMGLAITLAIIVMLFASELVGNFIAKYFRVKLVALCFLILVGVMLLMDGLMLGMPKSNIYCAVLFALLIEFLNIKRETKRVG